MTDIDGATILITGANGGLGAEFVTQALARGARRVYAAARTPREWGDARVVPLSLDVTDRDAIAQAADAAPDVDIVINNAGILRRGDLLTGDLADIEAMWETNTLGPLLVARAFAPRLVAASGALVNIGSVLSWYAAGKGYSMSKAALWSQTEGLRLELAPQGVHVMGVYLAYTDTPMNAGMDPAGMNTPADVVAQVYDGLVAGAGELLADDTTRAVRSRLSQVG
ncbi:SDR family oxidoreductase [Microbacterium sp. 10M-3C3]|jgi:NAD(P)-dependent dehydrogenase (short-subunit alcohol dehydrogenase family)|uniref:SDR family oxidoreductase n=1 Tax=Microbacterium sp. 10M-3C3 TaxID=2483401 RepID=UPI000F63B903|nr:SDR family oxidoreductase [Microbacterium sp. 10M-3C3]